MHSAIGLHRRPNNSRRINFLDNLLSVRTEFVNKTEVARTDPKLFAVPSQCLRCDCRRRNPLSLLDCWNAHGRRTTSVFFPSFLLPNSSFIIFTFHHA